MTSPTPRPSRPGRCSSLLVDILWGAVLTGLATLAGWLVFRST